MAGYCGLVSLTGLNFLSYLWTLYSTTGKGACYLAGLPLVAWEAIRCGVLQLGWVEEHWTGAMGVEDEITGTYNYTLKSKSWFCEQKWSRYADMMGGTSPNFNCLYSKAGSQGNKQEELKFLIYNYKFHLLGIAWNLVGRFMVLEC